MFKNFLVIAALVYCTSFGANAKPKIWDDECGCLLPDKIKTISPPMVPKSNEQIRKDFQEHKRRLDASAEKSKNNWIEKNVSPEQRALWNKKSQNWKEVSNPSFCIGYAKTKMEQNPEKQYYKDMYEFYDSKVSSTDLMLDPVDNEALLQGYDLNDDNLIMECVTAFDKIRGFD